LGFSEVRIGVAIPESLLKECTLLLGCDHPINGASNPKVLFLTISAYKPPSAAKLISSKKTPYIVGWILVIDLVKSTSKFVFWAVAKKLFSNKPQTVLFVIKFNFIF